MKKLLIALFLISKSLVFSQNANDAKKLLDEVNTIAKRYDKNLIRFKYVIVKNEENIKQEMRGDVV